MRERPARTRAAIAPLLAAAVALAALTSPPAALAATFTPNDVIADSTFRAYSSMSLGDIQSFLDAMPGILKTYRTRDHLGVPRPASRIIYDAARAWRISPKVILCMLQKEQGLLTIPNPDAERIREAMGCGIFAGSTNTYPGFGNQVWNGARRLHDYPTQYHWHPGMRKLVYGGTYVTPVNASTFSLYVYNPSLHGNEVFWTVYWRYFGDPHLPPWRKPVYRFRYLWNGRRVYTASEGERYRLIAAAGPFGSGPATSPLSPRPGGRYAAEGIAFIVNTASPANTSPVWRLYASRTRAVFYTASASERLSMFASRAWVDAGVPFKASLAPVSGSIPVYRVRDGLTGTVVLTTDPAERDTLVAAPDGRYASEGVAFHVVP